MTITLSPLTRKISLSMAVIFFIFAAGLFYVNKILLPIQVKGMAIKAAQDALHRNVTFDSLQFSPLRGFVVTGLVIADRNDPSQTFLRARSASAQVLFFALLQKKIILPSVRIDAPEITLTRSGKDLWNFSDLLAVAPSDGKTAQPQTPMDMLISGFSVANARIILNDTSLGDNFTEQISLPQLKGSLSLKGSFNISGEIILPATQGSLKFETRTGLQDRSFKGTFQARNIAVNRYTRFSPAPLPVNIQALMIAEGAITTTIDNANTSISGDITLPGLNLTLADGTTLQGDIVLTKVLVGMNSSGLSVQGSALASKVALGTAAGQTVRISTLRADNAQAALKQGKLSAAGDIDLRELDVALGNEQTLKGNINIPGLDVTQNADGYAITADIKADDLSLMIGKDQSLSGNLTLKKTTARITGSAVQVQTDLTMKSAVIDLQGTSVKTDLVASGTRLLYDTGRLETELQGAFKNFSLQSQGIAASGTPDLNIHLVFDPRSEIPLSYTGALKVSGLNISGLPTVNELKNIQGEITFKTDSAATHGLTFSVLDTPVTLTAEISDLKSPRITADAVVARVNLAVIEKLFPAIIKDQGLSIKGSAALNINVAGSLAKMQDAKINASAKLTDVNLESKKMNQSLSSLNALVEYKSPLLSWTELSVNYQGKTWTSHGSLQDLVNPIVSATVDTENLTANIEAKKKEDKIQLTSLSGTYFDSTYMLIGDIFLPQGQEPNIDINGEFKLSLRDLPKMLPPDQAKQIEALQLAGILKIKTQVRGVPQNWQDLISSTSIETPALYMMGYQIADLNITAKQANGEVNPLIITGKLYGGDLNATSTVSLKGKKFPFSTGAKLENTSLELLKKDTPLKQQQLSGMVNATADLKGELLDIRNMEGTATLKIANGYLWSLDILSKVLSILSSTFQGGDVIVTDADATFRIKDQKVMSDNLTLRSATVTLVAEGWLDFDQNIEMNIRPRIEPKTTEGTINPLTMINPTDGLVNIRVYNTLTAPKFEHNISAPQVIKKTIQNTVGTFLKMFE